MLIKNIKASALPYLMVYPYCSDCMRVAFFQHENIQSSGTLTILDNACCSLWLPEQNTINWVALTIEIFFS